ncbi:hypothetical protein CEK29_14845 [Bordetella genomosp. 5]|uniref:glycosyltransferase n=1 Tax=Bordetella genomosp. 5 TaxID=1395608 RepID=UPI000B9EC891|nr:glycosyltransferase [Bordetella genomosp. 5]OZI41222.1 hypothetical protein CEK29_14845 [Bordetella genomosp. 5]
MDNRNTARVMPLSEAGRSNASADHQRLHELLQEAQNAHARLEQERAARVQAEKDLASVKALLRESNQQLAKQRRTLTWQFGEAVTRANSLGAYVMLPYQLARLSREHKRELRQTPQARKGAAALPAETANAIKEALDYVKRVRSPEVILWCARQTWPNDVRSKVLCEVARWARTSYPEIAEQIAEQLATLDPGAPHARQLAYSLYDAGIVTASARLLQAALDSGVRLNATEQLRSDRIRQSQRILEWNDDGLQPDGQRFDLHGDGPLVVLTQRSILHGRGASDNALHRYATSLKARFGDVLVISLAPVESDDADPNLARAELQLDGIAYKAAPQPALDTQPADALADLLSEAILAATVQQRPRAVLAWDDAHCALGAHAAARKLRVPSGLVLNGMRYFQKTAANHTLSQRAHVDLRLLRRALRQTDMLALGSTALHEPVQTLIGTERNCTIVPPLPLPAANLRGRDDGPADMQLTSTLRQLEGKRVIALTEDEPPALIARAVIDLYAEISLRQTDAVLLVLSGGKTAAAMRSHAVAIGLHEDQVIFAPDLTDAVSRELLLRRVELALFPYQTTRAEAAIVPSLANLLECMALGICPAVGPSVAYTNLVDAGDNGLCIDMAAPSHDTATQVIEVLQAPDALSAMGRRARESVQRRAAWQDYEEGLAAMLLQAAQPEPRDPARRAEPRLLHLKRAS